MGLRRPREGQGGAHVLERIAKDEQVRLRSGDVHHRQGPESSVAACPANHFVNTDTHVLRDIPVDNRLGAFGVAISLMLKVLTVLSAVLRSLELIRKDVEGLQCRERDSCSSAERGAARGETVVLPPAPSQSHLPAQKWPRCPSRTSKPSAVACPAN